MAIKVTFASGEANVTVRGLFQWDYGQVLEIECAEIGTETLEVHFAFPHMSEAIVRTCSFTNGVGTVTIPDECLEQTSAVTAWVCKRNSTQRHTIKTIVLPLTARTRPSNALDDIPASKTDAIGQLIEEINEAVDAIENGNITAAKALHATTAASATTATSATNATYATSAGSASNSAYATKAGTATTAEGINVSRTAYANIDNGVGAAPTLTENTIYLLVLEANETSTGILVKCGVIDRASLGFYTVQLVGESRISITPISDAFTPPSGVLSFYKIGGVTKSI